MSDERPAEEYDPEFLAELLRESGYFVKAPVDNRLQRAIAELRNAPTLNIKGKAYTTVSTRLEIFRRHFPDYAVLTDLMPADGDYVRVKATICTPDGVPVATGMAEENRSAGMINKTSAIENCETSSVGRALAAFGLHGGEYASADELGLALEKQKKIPDLSVHETKVMPKVRTTTDGPGLVPVPDITDEKVRWTTWMKMFRDIVGKSTSPDEIAQWWNANSAALGNLGRASKKGYDALHDYCEERKAQLAQEAGLTPLDAG